MKYTVIINQKAAIDAGLALDLIDLAVFDFIKDFIHSGNCTQVNAPDGVYFWISHKAVQAGLPLLNISTRQGIAKRVTNLVNAELLVRHPQSQQHAKSLYKIGPKYECLIFAQPDNESLHPRQQEASPPVNNGLHNYINNNEQVQLTTLLAGAPAHPHAFSENPMFDIEVFKEVLKEAGGAGVDLDFYHAKIKLWAQGAKEPKRRLNWKKVCMTWLQGDKQKNKLVMVKEDYVWD